MDKTSMKINSFVFTAGLHKVVKHIPILKWGSYVL